MCRENVTGRFGTGWHKCGIFIIFILSPPQKCFKSAFFWAQLSADAKWLCQVCVKWRVSSAEITHKHF